MFDYLYQFLGFKSASPGINLLLICLWIISAIVIGDKKQVTNRKFKLIFCLTSATIRFIMFIKSWSN
jgi:hypothetical protein